MTHILTFILTLISIVENVNTLVSIGANTNIVLYWERSQAYVNLIKQSLPWGNVSNPWQPTATKDPQTGWPTSDFGVVITFNAVDLGGAYFLSAKGNADITIFSNRNAYITNKVHDQTTNTMTAIVNIPENSTHLILCFANTTGPGLTDLVLLQPGYNLTSISNISNLLLAHFSRFDMLRFNPWTLSNTGFEYDWNQRTPLNWPQYIPPNHNPWETIPQIANQLNKTTDIWLNIPWNATDDYIVKLAQLISQSLTRPNLIYVEYSNEVWNYLFPQANASEQVAKDLVFNHGDPYHFNYDNCSNSVVWGWRRTVYQTKHIADLFKTVFGEENVGQWKRVRPILAFRADDATLLRNALDYFNVVFGQPMNTFHGVALAPYFDLGQYRMWSNLTVDQVLDGLNTTRQQFLPEQGWSAHFQVGIQAVYAAWYNLPMYGYEGGPDQTTGCGSCSSEAKVNANRDPRMSNICMEFLKGWYRFGFRTFNWFLAGASDIAPSWSWSLLEDLRQETIIDTTHLFNATSRVTQLPRPAPKMIALDQVRQSSVELNFGISIPTENFNATNFMTHSVPYPNPDLRNLSPNSTFFYPIQIHQSSIQLKIIVYVSGQSGLLEGGINNEQFIQVQTPTSTTFQPTLPMLFNITQSIVPSLITFRLKNINSGYSIRSFDVVSF